MALTSCEDVHNAELCCAEAKHEIIKIPRKYLLKSPPARALRCGSKGRFCAVVLYIAECLVQVAAWRSVKIVGKNKIKLTSHRRAKVNAREQGDVLIDMCAPIGLFYRTMCCCSRPFVFPQPEAKFTSWSTAVAKTSLFP